AGAEREVLVALVRLAPAPLEEAAVEEHAGLRRLDEVHRAGDRARRSEEMNSHLRIIADGGHRAQRWSAGDRARHAVLRRTSGGCYGRGRASSLALARAPRVRADARGGAGLLRAIPRRARRLGLDGRQRSEAPRRA